MRVVSTNDQSHLRVEEELHVDWTSCVVRMFKSNVELRRISNEISRKFDRNLNKGDMRMIPCPTYDGNTCPNDTELVALAVLYSYENVRRCMPENMRKIISLVSDMLCERDWDVGNNIV